MDRTASLRPRRAPLARLSPSESDRRLPAVARRLPADMLILRHRSRVAQVCAYVDPGRRNRLAAVESGAGRRALAG